MNRNDDVAIAVDSALSPRRAADAAGEVAQRLDDAGVPSDQRIWIIAADAGDRADDRRAARIAAVIADSVGPSSLIFHDRHAPDDLIFQRRIPGQRRGGVYLNRHWQEASVRIGIGDPLALVHGLSAWFNHPAQLGAEDLDAALLLPGALSL